MFWKAFRVTLGILAALVASYVLVIVVLVAWADGWLARNNTWVVTVVVTTPVVVVLRLMWEAWEARRSVSTTPPNLPDPRIDKARTN